MIAPGTPCRGGGAPAYSSVAAAYGRDPVDGVLGWLGLEHDREPGLVLSSCLVEVDHGQGKIMPSRMRARNAVPWCLVLLPSGAAGWVLASNLREARP